MTEKKMESKVKSKFGRIGLHLALLFTSVLMVMPLVWAFFISFKEKSDIISPVPRLLPHVWTLANYAEMARIAPFARFFLNSVIICSVVTLAIAIGCPMAGYVFAKYRFKGQSFLFFLILGTMLVPLQTYLIPLYLVVRFFGWINTYQGMIFPLIIMSSGIFFLRQNIMAIPDDLIDAGRIDGCSEFKVFSKIIYPLSLPAIAAISIVMWVYSWSVFIWYLVIANSEKLFTMEVGLMYFQRRYITDYGGIMAACVVTIIPPLIFFLIFRTRIIEGVTLTGMKY